MNPKKTHVAAALFPLLVAACSADPAQSDDSAWMGSLLDGEGGESGEGGAGGSDAEPADEGGSKGAMVGAASAEGATIARPGGGEASGAALLGLGVELGAGPAHLQTEGGVLQIGEGAGEGGGSTDGGASTSTGGAPEGGEPGDICAAIEPSPLFIGVEPWTKTADTTQWSSDDFDSCWSQGTSSAADGKDRVFAFDVADAGVFTVKLWGLDGFDPQLSIRTDCETEEYCHDLVAAGQGHKEVHRSNRQAGERVYVVVDGPGTSEGSFSLQVSVSTPTCGDGVISGDEECDGAGYSATDGCGDPKAVDACKFEAPTVGSPETCADAEEVVVTHGKVVAGTLNGYTDQSIGNCMPEVGGADRVYRLLPTATGRLQVRAGVNDDGSFVCQTDPDSPGCFDIEIYARSSCDPMEEVACSSDCCDGETIELDVVENEPVYLFIDGYDQEWYSKGPYKVRFDYLSMQGE